MSDGSWTWSPDPQQGGGSGTPGPVPPPVPPDGAPIPPDASPFSSQFTVAMPGARPGVQTWSLEYQPAPRRRRTGLWVGVGLGVVALLGAAVAGWVLVGAKLVAPASPTAAVDRFVDGLQHKDGLALLGSLSPAEVQPFRQMASEMTHDASAATTADPATLQTLQDAFDSVTITPHDLQLTEETLDVGLTKVSITSGTLTLDGDPEAIADAVVAAMGQSNPLAAQDATAMHDEIARSLTLPYTLDFADEDVWDGTPFYLVTVREGRGWYISPLMTLGDYMLIDQDVTRGAMPSDVDVAHPASPQEAAQQLAAAIPALVDGDSKPLVAVLPEAERRFVAVYLQPLIAQATADGQDGGLTLTADDFEVADETADRASVVPTNLAYTLVADGVGGTISFDGDCLVGTADDGSGDFRGCISDVPLLTELGLDHPALVTVKEDGGWYVSAIGTFAELSRVAGDNMTRLQQEGKLDDPEWLEQQMPGASWFFGLDGADVQYDDETASAEQNQLKIEAETLAVGCLNGDPTSCDQLCTDDGLALSYLELDGEMPLELRDMCVDGGSAGGSVPSTQGG